MKDFLELHSHVSFVFEHLTDVPGLSDSLKHLEGFYNICKNANVAFLKGKIVNSRSKTQDGANPAELLGIDILLQDLSKRANELLNLKSLSLDLNFNKLASGNENAHIGSHIINALPVEQKIDILLQNIAIAIREELGVKSNVDLISFLSENDIKVIHIKFNVHHISIISQFIDSSSRDFKNILINNVKNVLDVHCDDNELNIVLHFRQGDTSVFLLPDGRLLSAWGNWRIGKKTSDPEFIDDMTLAAYKQYSLTDFILALERIINFEKNNRNRKICITFISDGFIRGVERIKMFKSELHLEDSYLRFLEYYTMTEEMRYYRELRSFSARKGVKLDIYIGETSNSFLTAVKSIAKANILVAGVGGFSRTMFDYFAINNDKIVIENIDNDNYCSSLSNFLIWE